MALARLLTRVGREVLATYAGMAESIDQVLQAARKAGLVVTSGARPAAGSHHEDHSRGLWQVATPKGGTFARFDPPTAAAVAYLQAKYPPRTRNPFGAAVHLLPVSERFRFPPLAAEHFEWGSEAFMVAERRVKGLPWCGYD